MFRVDQVLKLHNRMGDVVDHFIQTASGPDGLYIYQIPQVLSLLNEDKKVNKPLSVL